MNTSRDPDMQFDDNLRVLGSRIPVPGGPSDDVRSRCLGEFDMVPRRRQSLRSLRRPAVLSTLGMAASLAVAVGLLFPVNGGPKVEAATILAKLKEQIAQPNLIELTMEDITIEEVSVSGHVQVATEGLAGDVHAIINEDDEGPLEVDVSFGIGQDAGWVLLRKLSIPDPDVQQVIDVLLPPDAETLLLLPDTVDFPGVHLDVAEGVEEVSSAHKVIKSFMETVRNQPDTDAIVEERRDGTLVLTVPIPDAKALEDFVRMASKAANEEMKRQGKEEKFDLDEIEIEGDDEVEVLFGSTLHVEYDPKTESVRRFAITDFGQDKGTLSVELRDGRLDTSLLDPDRVTGPKTRTIDLSAFVNLIEKLGD